MNCRIEKKDAFKIICKKVQVTKPQSDTAVADISAFWNKCSTDGTMEQICKYGKFDSLHGVLGICFSDELAGSASPRHRLGVQRSAPERRETGHFGDSGLHVCGVHLPGQDARLIQGHLQEDLHGILPLEQL